MEENKIIISIHDNGSGFDQDEIHKEGLGLKSLHSRTQLLKGKMFVESKRGTGTAITFEIPAEI
jgi:signal transduction histidine kinase